MEELSAEERAVHEQLDLGFEQALRENSDAIMRAMDYRAQSVLIDSAASVVERGKWSREGVICPCCTQLVKVYQRKLTSTMVKNLAQLAQKFEQTHDWVHIHDIGLTSGSGDFAKLQYWGFIMSKKNDDSKKRCSGLWMPLKKASDFLYRDLPVPKAMNVFNGKCIGPVCDDGGSIPRTTAREAAGDKFDYAELIARG